MAESRLTERLRGAIDGHMVDHEPERAFLLEEAADRIEALEQALRDTRYGGAPYNSRRYDEITMLLSSQDQHSEDREGGKK